MVSSTGYKIVFAFVVAFFLGATGLSVYLWILETTPVCPIDTCGDLCIPNSASCPEDSCACGNICEPTGPYCAAKVEGEAIGAPITTVFAIALFLLMLGLGFFLFANSECVSTKTASTPPSPVIPRTTPMEASHNRVESLIIDDSNMIHDTDQLHERY